MTRHRSTTDAGARLAKLVQTRLDQRGRRRHFLKLLGAAAAGAASAGCAEGAGRSFFQQHYQRLSDADKERIFEELERAVERRTGVKVNIDDPPPLEGVEFGFAINLSLCNGNRRCVEACARENNQSRDPQIHYIRVLELDKGSLDVEGADPYFEHDSVPAAGKFYLPVQCNQCANPPCVSACPVGATWSEKDGIVVIDSDWCIGCRFCQAACPYEARHFNFAEPNIPPDEINPNQAYLSNRIRPSGVVEKCHFCLHRTRRGRYPACLEACPTGARKFGNMLDPSSEVRRVIERKRVFVLKEELGTRPRLFYYFD
jgi:molybdopterin-containing oxidoreductase family iron-sulfur binding subunit